MKKIILSSVLAGLIVSPVWAQRMETDKAEMESAFHKADMIADGHVDAGEFDIYNLSIFDALDQDGDQALIEDECSNGCFPTDLQKENDNKSISTFYRFKALDGDHNKKVAEAEYISYARKQFRNYDRNEDKILNKDEFFTFYQGIDERMFMVNDSQAQGGAD